MMIHTKANYLIIVGMRKLSPFVPTGSSLTRSSPAGPRALIRVLPPSSMAARAGEVTLTSERKDAGLRGSRTCGRSGLFAL